MTPKTFDSIHSRVFSQDLNQSSLDNSPACARVADYYDDDHHNHDHYDDDHHHNIIIMMNHYDDDQVRASLVLSGTTPEVFCTLITMMMMIYEVNIHHKL